MTDNEIDQKDIETIQELLEFMYDEYDIEPSEKAKELGRKYADLPD